MEVVAPPSAARAPKGTHDVVFPESARWARMVSLFAARVEAAGYGLVISPTFEDVRVFRRGLGDETDVVGKEMYEFDDKAGRRMALRPEGTASVVRAFVQLHPTTPWKAWYVAPMFRYEEPQEGRYRQHHQLGVEVLGSEDPDLDVEVLALGSGFCRDLGLSRTELLLSSMGDDRCRPPYVEELRRWLDERRDELCDEHRTRYAKSPLRVLDCKKPECRAATEDLPGLVDRLCEECAAHFERVKAGLCAQGIAFTVSKRLVRGFDYYTRTTFEIVGQALAGAQSTIVGGGRYDRLAEALGGPPTPGIGFGSGIERMLLACDAEGTFAAAPAPLDAYVVDTAGGETARDLIAQLRGAGLRADRAFDGRSMKSQMKSADRSGALVALIVGPQEAADGTVVVRPLRAGGAQQPVGRQEVVGVVRAMTEGER